MELLNAVKGKYPMLPEELRDKIKMASNFSITDHEAELFFISTEVLLKYLKENNIDILQLSPVNVIFTQSGKVSLKSPDEALGNMSNLIIYCMQKIRKYNYSDPAILAIYEEELCHHFFDIEDEIYIKDFVFNIIKTALPAWFTKEMLYNEVNKNGK